MTIADLIDYNFQSVSILEDTRQVMDWFVDFDYFIIVDESLSNVGVLTLKDIVRQKGFQVCDLSTNKPIVTSTDTLEFVFNEMEESQSIYLPVSHNELIVGVISLFSVTRGLLKQ